MCGSILPRPSTKRSRCSKPSRASDAVQRRSACFSLTSGSTVVRSPYCQPKATPMCRKSIKKKLEPRLADAQAGKRAVFFVDAAHFVFGAFLGYLWCFARCWIKAPSGRQRFNVLGALHAITHEVTSLTHYTYTTTERDCQLLRTLGGVRVQVPITLVFANPRYQRCALVQSVAD